MVCLHETGATCASPIAARCCLRRSGVGFPQHLSSLLGSVISVCRLAQTNIRLDSVTSIALHQCVLRPEGVDPETVAECIQTTIDESNLSACTETEVTVTFDDVTRETVDPDTGENLVTLVPMAEANIVCLVSTFGDRPRGQRASWVPDTELESTVTASRN